jgi:hypothetical protein
MEDCMKCKALLVSALLALSLSGCALFSGTEGDAYIAYSWAAGPITFYTEDPSFGSTIYNGQYENASVGSWYFEYISWDDSYWYGTYTVYVNDGGFLIDGEDIYFELACYSTGPALYEWSPEWAYRSLETADPGESADDSEKTKAAELGMYSVSSPSVEAASARLFEHDGTLDRREVLELGNYTIILEYSRLDP